MMVEESILTLCLLCWLFLRAARGSAQLGGDLHHHGHETDTVSRAPAS